MSFQNAEDFAMAKGLRRGSEADFARRRLHQIVSRESLNECGLAIATRAKYHALNRVCASTASDYIDGAVLTRIFSRWRTTGHRIRHLGKLSFLFGRRQRTNLLLEQFLGCGHALHDLAIEQPSKRPHVRHLRMILVPDRMREPSPGQGKPTDRNCA